MGELRDATVTLSNSIIGVAILAMPYCYARCGFVLATGLLLLAGLGTTQSCQMLLKSSLATKKRSYEFLAHQVYGPLGKLAVEFCLIGLSLGTLVAFFVVIGDLCPQVLAPLLGLPALAEAPGSRAVVMATIGVCVILPLSLMRDQSALSKFSAASLMFYLVFMLHLASLAFFGGAGSSEPRIAESAGAGNVPEYNFFRIDGLLYCLPIFGLAFNCQTQMFLLCDSLRDPSIKVVRRILQFSVCGCCAFYILIGSLGYLAFNSAYPGAIHGDLMTMYPGTLASDLIKLGFVLSVAVSFPIIVFPCRVSIYSFIYLQQHRAGSAADLASGRVFIPEPRFRAITSVIVLATLIGGLLIPNVEFILSLTGAVTGSMICYILPAGIYLRIFARPVGGSVSAAVPSSWRCCVARLIKWFGVLTLCVGTAATLMGQQQQQRQHLSEGERLASRLVGFPPMLRHSPQPIQIGRASPQVKLQYSDSESRREPPLPDADIGGPKMIDRRLRKRRLRGKTVPNKSTSTVAPSTLKSTLLGTTSRLRPTSSSTSESAPKATAAAAAAAAAVDLAVLAQLLREQQEQGRRIEAQLRRIEAAGGAAGTQPPRESQQPAGGSGSTTSVSANSASAKPTSVSAKPTSVSANSTSTSARLVSATTSASAKPASATSTSVSAKPASATSTSASAKPASANSTSASAKPASVNSTSASAKPTSASASPTSSQHSVSTSATTIETKPTAKSKDSAAKTVAAASAPASNSAIETLNVDTHSRPNKTVSGLP